MSKQTSVKLMHTKRNVIITAAILNFFFGNIMRFGTVNDHPVTFADWILLMLIANVIFVLPVCLVILMYCKVKNTARERIKTNAQSSTKSKCTFLSSESSETAPEHTVNEIQASADSQSLNPSPELKLSTVTAPSVLNAEPAEITPGVVDRFIPPLDPQFTVSNWDSSDNSSNLDVLFEAGMLAIQNPSPQKITLLQRNLKIGFNRALYLCEQLVKLNVLKSYGSNFDVLMDTNSFCQLMDIVRTEIDKKAVSENVEPSTTATTFDLSNMTGHEFEHYCAELLKSNGFTNVTVTKGSGDHGADILAEKDDISYAIQCKYYSGKVGNSAVQEIHSGKDYYRKDIAVVITNSYFTPQAIDEAGRTQVKLWDNNKLQELSRNSSSHN